VRLRPEQRRARAQRQPELALVRRQSELAPEQVSQPALALVRALEPASRQEPVLALQQGRALARVCPAVVEPVLSWLEERVLRPATCRAVRVYS
jgi:hypothetical protein